MMNPVVWHWGTATLPEAVFFVLVLGSFIANALPNYFSAAGDLEWTRRQNLNGQRERLGYTSVRNQWSVCFQHVVALLVSGYFLAMPSPAPYGQWVLWAGFGAVIVSVSLASRRWKLATQAILQRETTRRLWLRRRIKDTPPATNGEA